MAIRRGDGPVLVVICETRHPLPSYQLIAEVTRRIEIRLQTKIKIFIDLLETWIPDPPHRKSVTIRLTYYLTTVLIEHFFLILKELQ